jgi:peroxiredoxin
MKHLILSIVTLILAQLTLAQNAPKGLNVNDKAPDFTATDQSGKKFNLRNELKNKTVVVVFYCGQWCPYCNKQLKQLEDSLSFIKDKGATLIAVTPEKPENISKTISKTKASYPVLFDEGLKIMKAFDVAFAVDSSMINIYKKYGIDFTDANGKINGANLPVPAVYIINQQGVIIYRHFDPDYKQRASVQDILAHL